MVDREREAEELFGAVLELPPEHRAAFLDQACRSTPWLRELVDHLLREEAQLGNFLNEPLFTREPDPASTIVKSLKAQETGRFATGEVIADRFEVVRFIARGGMGEVYEAKDKFLKGVEVALKIIRPEIAGDSGTAHRFEQEVILARKVAHANLCPIYDMSRCEQPAPGFFFLTMKLLRGETLDSRLKRERILTGEGVEICRQLLRGMAALHEANILHRDIKPNNIMLEPLPEGNGARVFMMDFGLARLHLSDSLVTNSVTMAGTLGYMAPELLRGQPPTKASDLFALGIVMHQVLAGERPTESVSRNSTDWQLKPTAALRSMPLPPHLALAVEGFLAANPETRNRAFDAALAAEGGVTSTVRSSRRAFGSARPAWYALAAVLVLMTLALGAWLTAKPLPRPLRSQQLTFSMIGKTRPLLTDGSRLYFQARGVPAEMSINGGVIAPIPSFQKGMEVRAVSPDGSEVMAILPDSNEYPLHGQLWMASSLGGAPSRFGSWSAQDARWSPDGKTIMIAAGHDVYLASADGTSSKKIWEAPGTVDSVGFSPDGKELTLAVITKENSTEWRMKADGSGAHPLSFNGASQPDQWFGQWTPNGKHFVFLTDSEKDGDLRELVSPRWFEFWKKPASVSINATGLPILAFAPGRDGESLYVMGQLDEGAMQVFDPASGKYIPFLDGLNTISFVISPDRQWMAYTEYPTGNLMKSKVDGSEPQQLTSTLGAMEQWSPDGMWLVYSDLDQLYVIPADGGQPKKLTDTPGEHEVEPTWAPDGKSVLYQYNDYLGRPMGGIHVVELATRKATVLSGAEGLESPLWTSNGKFLLAVTKDRSRMMLYTAKTRTWKELKHFDVPLFSWALSPDNQSALIRLLGKADGVYRLSLPEGKWQKLSGGEGLTRREGEGWLSVTADGRPAIMTHTSVAQIYSLHWEK